MGAVSVHYGISVLFGSGGEISDKFQFSAIRFV